MATALRAVRGNGLISPSLFVQAFKEGSGAGTALLDELTEAVRSGWRPSDQELGAVLDRLPPEAREKVGPLRDAIARGTEEQRAKMERFQPLLSGGDPARGRAVFFGPKVACSACHAIGSDGGRVGPDLTKVGAIRSGRDILESVVFPSSTFAQGYEPYLIATADGSVVAGLIAHQDAEAVVLKDASGTETRVSRSRIREMKRGTTSIMPEGLERNLAVEEFRDLLAFLQSLR